MSMRLSRIPVTQRIGLILSLLTCAAFVTGCDEESDPPIIDTSVTPTDVPSTEELDTEEEVEETEEEEGEGGSDAGPKKAYKPIDPLKIGKCCAAIAKNKAGAPLTQHGLYDLALGACSAAKSNPAALYRVSRILPNAPAVCQ